MAKVLLVEDDNNLREIYQARLQAEGYTIVSARDGEEGLVVAKAEKPDLIVADVMMPKISGFEMLDIIRNTDTLKAVKIIMLTALGQSDDQKRADKLGADRYLVKSQVTLEDIVKAAHELLGEDNAPAPAGTSEPTAPTAAPTPAPAEPKAEAPAAAPTIEVKSAPTEPAPAPAPAPEAKAETAATDDATSAKQEATEAEAKIEDFVAGATSVPTTPAAPAATPAPAPAATPSDDDKAASDDKLMADAVDSLNASLDPDDKDSGSPAAPSAEAKKASAGGGSKKVIQPIETSETKKDIHTLLAEEEAKEAAASAGTVNPPAPATPPADDDQAKPADPNSIAL